MRYTNDMIMKKLENYRSVKKKLDLLSYELSHPAQITENEYLSAVATGTSRMDAQVRGNGPNLDKTLGLAVSYREKTEQINSDIVSEVFREWRELKAEIDRLDFYMGLLEPEHGQILRQYYVQGKKWHEIEEETNTPRRTIMRWRNEAVEHLTEMYNYTSKLNSR